MKFTQSTLLTILGSIIAVQADCEQTGGNYYCSKTNKISYSGIGYSGSYKDVSAMDEDSGSCTQKSKSFSGNLSPLDEELSVHFRGPLKLLQFGVYYPSGSSSNKKRDDEDCTTTLFHGHHQHKRATDIVEVTQTVIVDSNGNTVTSEATTTAQATPTSSADSTSTSAGSGSGSNKFFNWGGDNDSSSTTETESTATSSSESDSETTAAASSSESESETTSSSSSDSTSVASGDWERVAYYEPGSTDNVTFMNYYGGSGSGVWSANFGNSLSYANSDASGGSSKAVALKETTVDSDVEFMIFSGDECGDSDCGFYRDGIPAYHGFGGDKKIFVFEFEMPTATDSASTNYDMPAIWLLNAKIPRTLQYGDDTCSCWKTGCGELDLFEILSEGSDKLISHLHDGQGDNGSSQGGGGTQDYFARPTSSSLKAAVIFDGESISIVEVDSDFESSLSSSDVSDWTSDSDASVAKIST